VTAVASLTIGGIRGAFFNPSLITSAMDKGKVRALSRCGAVVRMAAQGSLKYGKKPSAPGRPPRVIRLRTFTRSTTNKKTGVTKTRATSPLRELLFFAYDAGSESVVVGPAEFRARKSKYAVPRVLEKGGKAPARREGGRAITIRPRPFMDPALKKKAPQFPGFFKNILGKG
jgi:hypothetical protein